MPKTTVYLDNAATTPVDNRVIDSIVSASLTVGNSASALHSFGEAARKQSELARSQIAGLIGASEGSIILTSGATESNNLAILGCSRAAAKSQHLICSGVEHRSVLAPFEHLSEQGVDVTIIDADEFGLISPEQVAAEIRPNTSLVSIVFADSEVGAIRSIAKIGELCRAAGILFHTDATQAVGKIPIDVATLAVDLMSFSAHKIYGPKGIGALFIDHKTVGDRIQPIMYGGGQQKGIRPGTLPVPLIVGFGKACELCKVMSTEESQRIGALRDRLWERFQNDIPDIVLNGSLGNRLNNILNISFLGVLSEAFMIKLRDVVAVSAGSACTSARPEPSHVLRSMGIHGNRLESAIRFGLGRFTSMDEIEYVADHVRDAVTELRNSS